MADRDVDVSLNVQVQGEKDVNSLSASLTKLAGTAKTSTTSAGASITRIAKNVNKSADTTRQAVRQLYAYRKGEQIGTAIRTVMTRVAAMMTRSSQKAAVARVRPDRKAKAKAAADKGADQLDQIRKSVKGLSIAGTVAASIYVLRSALAALDTVGRLILAPFRMLYSALETTFNYTKEFADKIMQIAPQAAKAHLTLAQAMTDNAAGVALLGKSYDSLNEKAVETYKKFGLKERQYTKPGGAIASMLEMTEYIAGRYGDLETKLAKAKTPKARKLADKMLTNYRDLMVENLPDEVANVAMTISKASISQFRHGMKFIDLLYSETGPRFTDKQYKQRAAQMTMGIATIGAQWQAIKDGIAKWSIDPINKLLSVVNEKLEAVGPKLKDLAGTLSAQAWTTLTEAIEQINVDDIKSILEKWTQDVKGVDLKALGKDIGASLNKLGSAITAIITWFTEYGPKLAKAAEVVSNIASKFGTGGTSEAPKLTPAEEIQRGEYLARQALEKRKHREMERAGGYMAWQKGLPYAQRDRLHRWFMPWQGEPEEPKKPDVTKSAEGAAAQIKTAGDATGTKISTSFKSGGDEVNALILAAFSQGGAAAGTAIAAAIANAKVTVSAPRGADTPSPG